MMLLLAMLAQAATANLPAKSQDSNPVEQSTPAALPLPSSGDAPRRSGANLPGTTSFLTAGDLRRKCEDNALAMVSYCYAYVTGVHDTVMAYETWLKMREFCRPMRLTQSDLRRSFLAYMDANPRAMSGEAASVVVVALKQAYSCSAPVQDEK